MELGSRQAEARAGAKAAQRDSSCTRGGGGRQGTRAWGGRACRGDERAVAPRNSSSCLLGSAITGSNTATGDCLGDAPSVGKESRAGSEAAGAAGVPMAAVPPRSWRSLQGSAGELAAHSGVGRFSRRTVSLGLGSGWRYWLRCSRANTYVALTVCRARCQELSAQGLCVRSGQLQDLLSS